MTRLNFSDLWRLSLMSLLALWFTVSTAQGQEGTRRLSSSGSTVERALKNRGLQPGVPAAQRGLRPAAEPLTSGAPRPRGLQSSTTGSVRPGLRTPVRTTSSASATSGQPAAVRPDVNEILKGVYRDPQFGAIPDPIRSRHEGLHPTAPQQNPFSTAERIRSPIGSASLSRSAISETAIPGSHRDVAADSPDGAFINRSTRRFFSGSVSRYRNLSQFSMTSSGRRQYVQTRTAEADALLARRLQMIRQMRQDAADIGDADALKEADRLESLARDQYAQRTSSMKSAEAAIDAVLAEDPAESVAAEIRQASDSAIE